MIRRAFSCMAWMSGALNLRSDHNMIWFSRSLMLHLLISNSRARELERLSITLYTRQTGTEFYLSSKRLDRRPCSELEKFGDVHPSVVENVASVRIPDYHPKPSQTSHQLDSKYSEINGRCAIALGARDSPLGHVVGQKFSLVRIMIW
jgi:hypothetical protein